MDAKKQAFFEENAELAMEEQIRYGIPASVTLIQMYWESGRGESALARNANNYFGVKDHRQGAQVYRANDADEKNAPFKMYDSKEASVRDHSLILMGKTYNRCHHLAADDYAGWLKGIKGSGYASAKDYDKTLINDLKAYNLQAYDKKAMEKAKEQGVKCGYMRDLTAPGERVSSLSRQGERRSTQPSVSGRELFRMPVDGRDLTMTSAFGPRIHPTTGLRDNHKGIDISMAAGTKLYSSEPEGVVKRVNWGVDRNHDGKVDLDAKGNPVINGKCVEVEYRRGNDVYTVQYLHMSRVDVKEGQKIGPGELIGLSGATGRGTGAHLHYGVKKNGEYINPLSYLAEVAILSDSKAVIKDAKKNNLDALALYKKEADRDVLLAQKADAERQRSDEYSLAQVKHDENTEEERNIATEDTVARTAKSNLFSAILGNDGSGLSQMFQGGSDLTSSIVQMLMMSFLALAFNKQDDEEQQQQQNVVVDQQNAVNRENEWDVRAKLDVKEMAEMASTKFDIEWSEQQGGQQITQQERSGYAVS